MPPRNEDLAGGPLSGIKVVEMAGMGPAPFACMLLADMGADVITVDRPGAEDMSGFHGNVLNRGRRSVVLDLKSPAQVETLLQLIDQADVLVEGYRPGVAERLGFGPDVVLTRNPSLVYGRMTGFGQDGPLAPYAGHDLTYIALTGTLEAIRRPGQVPVPPLNLVGDFGGGGMLLAVGVLAAVIESRRSGRGQVVDAAMVDGASLLATLFHGMRAAGEHLGAPGTNLMDGGSHFYDSFETADGKYIAVGAIEPQFYAEFCARIGLEHPADVNHRDPACWPELKSQVAAIIKTRTRDEWTAVLEGSDACAAPVLSFDEVAEHPHMAARGAFQTIDGVSQPSPAPRFSRTPSAIRSGPPELGQHTNDVLRDWLGTRDKAEALRGGHDDGNIDD